MRCICQYYKSFHIPLHKKNQKKIPDNSYIDRVLIKLASTCGFLYLVQMSEGMLPKYIGQYASNNVVDQTLQDYTYINYECESKSQKQVRLYIKHIRMLNYHANLQVFY
jgi:hypothetical protein